MLEHDSVDPESKLRSNPKEKEKRRDAQRVRFNNRKAQSLLSSLFEFFSKPWGGDAQTTSRAWPLRVVYLILDLKLKHDSH